MNIDSQQHSGRAMMSSIVPRSDAELTELIGTAPCPVVVLASTDDCVPCIRIKPVIRKLALEFSTKMALVEVTAQVAPNFIKAHLIDGYPAVLLFRGGVLADCRTGYFGQQETRSAITSFLGVACEAAPSSEEIAFQRALADASAAVDTIMKVAGDALAPHIEAVMPQLQAVEDRAKADREAGRLTPAEAQGWRVAELKRLYRPFQDKIDALRLAQEHAMKTYEARMEEGLRAFADAEPASAASRMMCRSDGSMCWIENS